MRCDTAAAKLVGSSSASSCPLETRLLKSACSLAMIPETWLPTWTVVTAERVPVAVTVAVTSPLPIGSVRYCGSSEGRLATYSPYPAPTRTAATAAQMIVFFTIRFIPNSPSRPRTRLGQPAGAVVAPRAQWRRSNYRSGPLGPPNV